MGNVNGGPGLKRLIEVSIILLLPRLMTRALSAEARDFSISALGIFISALSRNVSALSDLGLKRGRKRIMDQGSRIKDHGSCTCALGTQLYAQNRKMSQKY